MPRNLPETYDNGQWMYRYVIIDGHPTCVETAYEVAQTPAALLDRQRATNALVRERMAAVEAYEDALRLTSGEPPEQWGPAYGEGDTATPAESPEWTAYQAALAVVAAASDLTRAYALVRQGRPLDPAPGNDPSPKWLAYRDAMTLIESAD